MKLAKKAALTIIVLLAFSFVFFWIVNEDWKQNNITQEPVNRQEKLLLTKHAPVLEQKLIASNAIPKEIALYASLSSETQLEQLVNLSLLNREKELWKRDLKAGEFVSDGMTILTLEPDELSVSAHDDLTLRIESESGIGFWYGTSISAGKINVNTSSAEGLSWNGKKVNGALAVRLTRVTRTKIMDYYWPAVAAIIFLVLCLIFYSDFARRKGKPSLLIRLSDLISQYSYLLKTLVARDFKVKYKASVLGVVWSFLNPLLMTMVYLFVFSTLFQSSIEAFPVYLMSGIIIFNFFCESTNLGMASIVGNASLITKVYLPKYIFPISKVLSAAINFLISMIPLLIMMLITGAPISKSMLLIPLLVVFLVAFCIGVSLVLSASLVYFRDVQFLWGIILTILNFVSPIFYPESIIPAKYITLYHLNPLYQYLFFMRSITVSGTSPSPAHMLYCIIASVAALLIGFLFFHKVQHRFVLHL